jgi:hypothetical protein
MPSLDFSCTGARPERYALSPTLLLGLHITESTGTAVHAAMLRCQLRIEPYKRRYSTEEAERLVDLFGEPSRWGDTLKPMQLAMATVLVPGFTGSVDLSLPVDVSYDVEVAAGKYFNALSDGEIPLLLLFSGTVFYSGGSGLYVDPVPWHKETAYRLPVSVWREMIDQHFPGMGWIRMRTETLAALQRYRSNQAIPNWDATFERLLKDAGEPT